MFSDRFRRGLLAAALASAAVLTAGCATETAYRPAVGRGFDRQGYSERQIEPSRFIVSFSGNTVTSRDTVERYLLYRAAELTLQQGNDYFVMVDRDTDRQSRTYATPGFGPYGGFGYGGFGYGGYGFGGSYFSPYWRFHRGGYGGFGGGYRGGFGGYGGLGWGGYGFGDPFFNDVDIQTVDRFEAEAQIVMRRGPVPEGNVRAFDAHKVVQTLGPSIVTPEQQQARRHGGHTPPPPAAPRKAPIYEQ